MCPFFQTNSRLLWKFHLTQKWFRNLWTLSYEAHVGDFISDNHFVIFNFLLIYKKSITMEMHIELWVYVILDVQCDHDLLLPLLLIASAVGRFNYWWIFCLSIPYCWKPFNVFILLCILEDHLFHDAPDFIISWIEVTRIVGHFHWDNW